MDRTELDQRFVSILAHLDGVRPSTDGYASYRPEIVGNILRACTEAVASISEMAAKDNVFLRQLEGHMLRLNVEGDTPASSCRATIEAARAHFVGGFDRIRRGILAEAFDDLLSMAQYLHESHFHLAAVAICGSVMEDSLRKMYVARIGPLPKADTQLNVLNQALFDAGTYDRAYWRQVQAWADLRNETDHGRYSNSEKHITNDENGQPYRLIDPQAVSVMLVGVQELIVKYQAS